MEKNEEVISSHTLGYMKYSSQFYGLDKKIKNARKDCIILSEIVILTIKIDSSISNVNICFGLKLPMPIMLRDFFRRKSQKLEKVKSVFNTRTNPFLFACGIWMINR